MSLLRSLKHFFEAVKPAGFILPGIFLVLTLSAVSAQNTKGDRPAPASGSVKENQTGRNALKRKKSNTGGQIRTSSRRKVISSKNPFVNNPSREPSSGDKPSVAPRRVKTPSSASQGRATSFSSAIPVISNSSSRPISKDQPYRGGRTASGKRLVTRKPENRSVNIYRWRGPELNNVPRAPESSEKAWPENRTASGQKIVRREPPAQNRNIYPRRSVFINNPVAEPRVSEKVSSRPDIPLRTVRSSDGSKVTRSKIIAQSISGSFVTQGKKNVYWGKYSPSRGRIMTDMYGRPLRRMDYRTPGNVVFPKDTLPNVDRRTRRETPSTAKTPGYKSATRTGTAWQGDISGKKLRNPQRDPRRSGPAQSGQQRLQVAGLSGRRDMPMANPTGLKAKLALMLSGKSASMRRKSTGIQTSFVPGSGVFKRSVVSMPGTFKGNIRTSARYSGNISTSSGNRDLIGFNPLKRKAQPGIGGITSSGLFRSEAPKGPGMYKQNMRAADAVRQSLNIRARSAGAAKANVGSYRQFKLIKYGNAGAGAGAVVRRGAQVRQRLSFDLRQKGFGSRNAVQVDSRRLNYSGLSGRISKGEYVPGGVLRDRRTSFEIRDRGRPVQRVDAGGVLRQAPRMDAQRRKAALLAGGYSSRLKVSEPGRTNFEIRDRGRPVQRVDAGGVIRQAPRMDAQRRKAALLAGGYSSRLKVSEPGRTNFEIRDRGRPVQRVDAGGVIRQAPRMDAQRRKAALLAGGYSGSLRVSEPGRQELTGRISLSASGGGKLPIGITERYSRPAVGAIGRREWERAGMNQRSSRPGLAKGATFGGNIPVMKFKYTPVHTPSWVKVLKGDFRKSLKVEKPGDREDRLIAGYADRVRVNPFRNPYIKHPDSDQGAIKKLRPDANTYAVNGLLMKRSAVPDRVNVEHTPMNFRAWSIDRSRLALTEGFTGKVRQGKYIHHPLASRDALMVREPDRAFIRTALIQSNVKMRKHKIPALHPDAKFAHLKEDNVQGEKSLLTGIKMVFDKKLKRNELQPASVKEKVRRPRYDPREIGIWYD
ncbi:MAG: hypothetical protein ACO3FI_03060 [Cyclobacteriaceae bacterium]